MKRLTVGPPADPQVLAERCVRLDAARILRIRATQDATGHDAAVLEIYQPALAPAPQYRRDGSRGPVDASIALPLHALRAIAGAFDRVASACGVRH